MCVYTPLMSHCLHSTGGTSEDFVFPKVGKSLGSSRSAIMIGEVRHNKKEARRTEEADCNIPLEMLRSVAASLGRYVTEDGVQC